ncbi:MAG: hypothetical protein Q8N99_00825 [Nanoarchaeota archaeon]|nr:hypothetical protein [Nanoarchaeota archaeon]
MQILEKTRDEIETRASKMSDFLRMEYLESCLKRFTEIEIQRYCYQELSRLYEKNFMYPDAIKYISKFQEVCISKREKIQAFLKEIELTIKGGFYDRIDFAYRKINEIATTEEIYEARKKMVDLLMSEAQKFEKSSKYSYAARAYERLSHLVTDNERLEVKKHLVTIYKKLGKVRESIELERELARSGVKV